MSVAVSAWVWEHAPVKSGELVVLLGLADNAHDDGTGAYPSQATLAVKSRMTERQVRRCLGSLEADGLIRRQGMTQGGVVVWAVVMAPPDNMSTRTSASDPPGHGRPTEPSLEPSSSERGQRAGARVKIGGKPVDPDAWRLTASVLDSFNVQAGRKLRLLTSAGVPSDAARRIYGRLRDYPDLTLAEHEAIIRRTLSSKWWGDDPPSIGVVFGPKVFEENITRPGTPRAARTNGERTASLVGSLMARGEAIT